MKINNQVQNKILDKSDYKSRRNISNKGAREIVRSFANPDSLATTLVLEGAVTTGRGANAYKRGGTHELRERFIDDVTSAVFWMGGVDIFNKIGDVFGKKILKLPITEFDVGEDALRKPFTNLSSKIEKVSSSPAETEKMVKTLKIFKLSKVVLSSILAIGFVGFILPKLNQKLTRFLFSKDKNNNDSNTTTENKFSSLKSVKMEDFLQNTKTQTPSFKGINAIAHSLENDRIIKMLTSDVGILSGRALTARNKDEAIEYAFRDSMSPIFYYASTPFIYRKLQQLQKSTPLTSLDPVASKQLTDEMVKLLNGGQMGTAEFTKKVFGKITDEAKNIMDSLPFVDDVIPLDKLKNSVSDDIFLQAKNMAKLQPSIAGIGEVLTKAQVEDVFRNGAITSPSFMLKTYQSKFGEKLTNPLKFIPKKQIDGFRDDMQKYAKEVINIANRDKKGIIDSELLKKINRSAFIKSSVYRAIGIAISAFCLGIVVPKAQYAITKFRTGSAAAPGLREFKQEKNA